MKKKTKKYRIKLYIPKTKWILWTNQMEKIDPYSKFFHNFSQWVRECLQTLPQPYLIIMNQDLEQNLHMHSEIKLEKTIWISEITHQALEKTRDLLSLNQFVIYVLEYHIFGELNPKSTFVHVSKLEQRIHQLEDKINYLLEKESVIFKKKN